MQRRLQELLDLKSSEFFILQCQGLEKKRIDLPKTHRMLFFGRAEKMARNLRNL